MVKKVINKLIKNYCNYGDLLLREGFESEFKDFRAKMFAELHEEETALLHFPSQDTSNNEGDVVPPLSEKTRRAFRL